jgi:hypothetical protein
MASNNASDLSGMLKREHHAGAAFASAAECRGDADTFQTGDKRFKDPHLDGIQRLWLQCEDRESTGARIHGYLL